jgi:hypothetical protein
VPQTTRDTGEPINEWKGSFRLGGLPTRMKIGGFVEMDAIADSGAIASRAQFITSTIATGNPPPGGAQSALTFNATRLYAETRTPLGKRQLTTFGSVDFFGHPLSAEARLRLREGYVELSDVLFGGDLLVGQTWGTFTDLEASPETLDYEGPNSFLGLRQPLVRWTRKLGADVTVKVAAETPSSHLIEGATSYPGLPDGVLVVEYRHPRYQLQGTLIGRDLRAGLASGSLARALGWGASFSGVVRVPCAKLEDLVSFQCAYGRGEGSLLGDAPPDAVFSGSATSNTLRPLPVLGAYIGYQHAWTSEFSTTATWGIVNVYNLRQQVPSDMALTRYASINIVWQPSPLFLMGIEGLWGKRADLSGDSASLFRTQFTTRVSF